MDLNVIKQLKSNIQNNSSINNSSNGSINKNFDEKMWQSFSSCTLFHIGNTLMVYDLVVSYYLSYLRRNKIMHCKSSCSFYL